MSAGRLSLTYRVALGQPLDMADKRDHIQGGVRISIGQGATFNAGDIAGHDMHKTTTTTTQVVDIEALGARLIELSNLVRELCRAVDSASGVDERQRDDLVHELSGASKELVAAGDEVRALPPGEPVPAALTTRIKDQLVTLDTAGKSAASLVTSVQALAHKLSPLIGAIGNMFG